MKLEYFISKRLVTSKEYKNSVSAPIMKIAVIAVAISTIMMLVSIATGLGLQNKIRDKITSFNGHIIISNYDNNQSDITLEPINIKQDFYPDYTSFSGVKEIHPYASKAGVIRTLETFEGVIYKGVGDDYNWSYLEDYIVEGRSPEIKKEGMTNEVLISEYLAKRLAIKLNDKIETFFMKDSGNGMPNIRAFEVVGIYNSGFKSFDETYVVGDLKQIQRLNKWSKDEVGAFEVYVENFSNINAVNDSLYTKIPASLNSVSIVDKFFNIFDWLSLFDFNIYVILGIMILVATINMIVALLVLILERTKMIGLLKSLGAGNWTIRKIFLLQASHIVFNGLIWGNIIGIGVLLVQRYFGIVKLDPTQYYVTEAPVYLNVFYIVGLNLVLIVICYLIMIIPSYIITKITPVKALRYQ